MKLFTTLPYKFIPLDGTLDPDKPNFSFIIKGTFALQSGRPAVAADEQADFSGDRPYMDKLGRSLRFANDLVAFKPFGEVLLTANCHAPEGLPATTVDVTLEAGPIRKRLRVFGDRVWIRDEKARFVIEGPVSFKEMPLRWEHAFGGLNLAENPMGRGIEPRLMEDGRKLLYLANIEMPDLPVRSREHLVPPVCFAPISPQWQPRRGREGTRDQHWATFVAPLPPQDYDPRATQAAPRDQWLKKGYWRGDEPIVLTNMHPTHATYASALPGKRLRLFIEHTVKDGERLEFSEIPLDLDTVHIDITEERMHLLWRQRFRPRTRTGTDVTAVYLAEEPLASEPAPIEAHHRAYLALKGPEPESIAARLAVDERAALEDARKTLLEANPGEAFMAQYDAAPGAEAKFDMVLQLVQTKTAELEAMTAAMKPL